MTSQPFLRGPTSGCDAYQEQLSATVDAGAPLAPALRAHLEACEECAAFSALWLSGAPAELVSSSGESVDERLRATILNRAAQPAGAAEPPVVVPFVRPDTAARRATQWLGRIAAGLVLAGLAYWLLNPRPEPVRRQAPPVPTLAEGFAQVEGQSSHEQQVLQSALVDGGREVRGNVAWSLSALEL
jgi:anti-sigma factor RsiW